MAKPLARRAITRIQAKADRRAKQIAEFIVSAIKVFAPYDTRAHTDTHGVHLRDSYKVRPDPRNPGEYVITSDRRYWVFVEFGTQEHGDAQPHVRPAIELAKTRFRR